MGKNARHPSEGFNAKTAGSQARRGVGLWPRSVARVNPIGLGIQVAERKGGPLSDSSMSLDAPALGPIDGAPFSFGVVAACFNAELVEGLLASLKTTLAAAGVKPERIELLRVPGSHEVPYAAQLLAVSGRHNCVIALGVLIGGDTNHHEMVGNSVSQALQQLSLAARLPVINGVIVANTRAQAEARCLGAINRGAEFARAALAMAELQSKFSR
jgi:6,7-dimethyl-8-ribityllumazine synthase